MSLADKMSVLPLTVKVVKKGMACVVYYHPYWGEHAKRHYEYK